MYIIIVVFFLILVFFKQKENFILRNVYPSNSEHNRFNQNILRYLKYDKVDKIGLELKYQEFDRILKDISKNFKNKNIKNINEIIIYDINSNYLKTNFSNKYGDLLFKYNDIKIIKNDKESLIYNLEIYRENKYHYFVVQIEIINFTLKNIEIIGILLNENLFNKNRNKDDIKKMFTQNNVDKLMHNKLDSYFKYHNEISHQCFGKQTLTKNHCISEDEDGIGVWDIQCKKNSECPFYKKNKNYTNERGRCINGYCEMPVNVTSIGFKKYKGKPLCYNCKKTNCKGLKCNECCEQQENKMLYPNLKSPDYMFEKDTVDRTKQKLINKLLI